MEELSRASDRYKILLETEQKRLKKSLTRLEKLSDLAQDNLKAARQKADVLKEQVMHVICSRFGLLVMSVLALFDCNLCSLYGQTRLF